MKSTTLVIMAAGIGSRFGGGIKQLEPVGPGGEIIMDYSIHDALEAGFDKIVFIIRKDLDKDFREIIGNRIERIAPVEYAYQELEDLPEGYVKPAERTKPWGTGQAILAAKDLVKEPFLVINADDYYGKEGFRKIHQYMVEEMDTEADVYDMCMGGFILSNTLSENGGVTRGVCVVNPDGSLKDVTETYNIERKGHGLFADDEEGNPVLVSPDQHVSMNMWGFTKSILGELENRFGAFLDKNLPVNPMKCEYFLPFVVDELLKADLAEVTVLKSVDRWYGVTYKEDKETVVKAIKDLKDKRLYPEKLWEELVK
mgnify:CR=1 FL=1